MSRLGLQHIDRQAQGPATRDSEGWEALQAYRWQEARGPPLVCVENIAPALPADAHVVPCSSVPFPSIVRAGDLDCRVVAAVVMTR